ncbi:MAG: hypothetical protein HC810_01425 [Acaryochloridaceae cyanobacterium RL_2_7]|nr:hypothetical protein [Acaryochloridaceae cyanobacterium RL_2_7]
MDRSVTVHLPSKRYEITVPFNKVNDEYLIALEGFKQHFQSMGWDGDPSVYAKAAVDAHYERGNSAPPFYISPIVPDQKDVASGYIKIIVQDYRPHRLEKDSHLAQQGSIQNFRNLSPGQRENLNQFITQLQQDGKLNAINQEAQSATEQLLAVTRGQVTGRPQNCLKLSGLGYFIIVILKFRKSF